MNGRSVVVWAMMWAASLAMGGCVSPPAERLMATAGEEAAAPADDPQLSVDTLIEAPEDYAIVRIDTEEYPVPPHAEYLEGVRICLDPGHGGDAHKRGYKRGPTGVREAEINLRVAEYLRDFLACAGAEVLLTREEDVASSLQERATLANDWPADLFISCHHNAIGKPEVNRTSVWYHRDVDYRPANLDLARHVCFGLYGALRLPQITGVPLKSDQLMYETGFGVLRHSRVTSALCESSFFTNPEEEQRLREPAHNLREAYGLFLGLARYAACGLPRARLVDPEDGFLPAGAARTVEFVLDDGLRGRKSWGADRQMILTDSIAARVDGEEVPHTFTNKGYKLVVELPDELPSGEHHIEVQFQNMFKNSVLSPHFVVEVE